MKDYDEGSNIDKWEAEQNAAEADFRDAYEAALGVRPVFSVDYLSASELQARTGQLQAAHAAGRF